MTLRKPSSGSSGWSSLLAATPVTVVLPHASRAGARCPCASRAALSIPSRTAWRTGPASRSAATKPQKAEAAKAPRPDVRDHGRVHGDQVHGQPEDSQAVRLDSERSYAERIVDAGRRAEPERVR